ncbi:MULTISPECIES: glycoside hydrolase family 30 protein [Pseudoxanthomonas]|uniref:Glucosylceramidase n=1 Tax=Pseudoxanthomonas winnipegensis TaxID=2480810 RepID=A0AAW8G8L1_9GAMM|nr:MULTISPECIES: glycoside hydrolase family 30 protein [Pseudoxanthomonas]MDQ1118689.1 glucosylceramidase [Pseudoxanthomonas winnipegensis]MDQ1131874.1 glucosylceramidase [Pseudoxanthomonas winnipegensis]MDR6138107.1 glucosylceramidase [Pseudoxanthomonas sp. SORGH_AS_0997]
MKQTMRVSLMGALLAAASAQGAEVTSAAYTPSGGAVTVYTSASGAPAQMVRSEVAALQPGHALTERENSIFVDPTRRFQTVMGLGGAITDAAAETYAKLSKAKQAEFMKAYYDPDAGIGYSWARTTIHSSDFSSASYTYIKEGDKDLKTFSIAHDRKYRIPMIKQAIAAAGGTLPMFASPWSAPAFMKDNKSMLKGGHLLPEYADAWANYYTKFIAAYEKEGIPIWGISIQNEPMAVQIWESMQFSAEQERDFLKDHLGPTMAKAGYGDRKIIVWDHNRDMMVHRANVLFDDPEAAKYAWGMGFHWYETWAGLDPMYDNVAAVSRAYPDKPLLLTEASIEKFDFDRIQDWAHGERYGASMIHDFNGGAVAWTDWNILLDEHGGPNHVGNYCFAPLQADTRTGELIYTPPYWYIGHFSKFIRPQAQRVSAASSRSNLMTTAFLNRDNRLATVVMNGSDQAITYNFYVGEASTQVEIPAHAIQTLVY